MEALCQMHRAVPSVGLDRALNVFFCLVYVFYVEAKGDLQIIRDFKLVFFTS